MITTTTDWIIYSTTWQRRGYRNFWVWALWWLCLQVI